MKDINKISDNGEIITGYGTAFKAKNLCMTQLKSLHYAKSFGLDMKYFLSPNYEIKNEAFKVHIIQRMAEEYINLSEVTEKSDIFTLEWVFNLPQNNNKQLVR